MKQIVAILLLGILLFNGFGFRLLTSVLENHANQHLESQLDENKYDESRLITLKIPATKLPYYNNSRFFERIDGRVEIEGISYNFVKLRLFNDSLELLCIANPVVMDLLTAKDDFYRLVSDLQQSGQGKRTNSHPGTYRNFSSDLFTWGESAYFNQIYLLSNGWTSAYAAQIHSLTSFRIDQPPEAIS